MFYLKHILHYGKYSVSIIGLCLLLSCQVLFKSRNTIPTDLRKYQSGTFSGFIVMNRSQNKQYFTADIAISQKGWLKADLFASMGLPIMSLLLKNKTGSVIFFQSGQYYHGKNIKKVIKKHIPLNVNILKDIFFQRPPANGQWHCQKNKAGLWNQCQYHKQMIQWTGGADRAVSIKGPRWHFIFHYSTFTPQLEKHTFSLKIPSHFKPLHK